MYDNMKLTSILMTVTICAQISTHKYKISVINTTVLFYNCYSRATCFDSVESSSGPPRNRSKII